MTIYYQGREVKATPVELGKKFIDDSGDEKTTDATTVLITVKGKEVLLWEEEETFYEHEVGEIDAPVLRSSEFFEWL